MSKFALDADPDPYKYSLDPESGSGSVSSDKNLDPTKTINKTELCSYVSISSCFLF